MIPVAHSTVELDRLVRDFGPLAVKYDGGRLPILDEHSCIVAYLGVGLRPEDVSDANIRHYADRNPQ